MASQRFISLVCIVVSESPIRLWLRLLIGPSPLHEELPKASRKFWIAINFEHKYPIKLSAHSLIYQINEFSIRNAVIQIGWSISNNRRIEQYSHRVT